MSLTATYDATLSRVQLSAEDLDPSAEYAVYERSVNEVLWFTLRGGGRRPVEQGASEIDDYEFYAADETHYRVRTFDGEDEQLDEFTASAPAGLLDGRVWWKSPDRHPLLNRALTDFGVSAYARDAREGIYPIAGRSLPLASGDLRLGRSFTLEVLAPDYPTADTFDVVLAATKRVFLHVPPEIRIPGGWFSVGSTSEDDLTGVGASAPRMFTLPLTAIAPPNWRITGTLLTAQTLWRLYGSAEGLYQAHETGRSLFALTGDPDDVVVI